MIAAAKLRCMGREMRSDDWVCGDWSATWRGWIQTQLSAAEQEGLRSVLTTAQQMTLLERDYVWVKGIGLLWTDPDGCLCRSRYTHGAHFRTRRGEFHVDSEGFARASATVASQESEARSGEKAVELRRFARVP